MKKVIFFFIALLLCLLVLNKTNTFAQIKKNKRYTIEFSLGSKIPMGITKDDIVTGLIIKAGIGYNLTKNFELAHLAIDFGNASPHNPDMVVVQDRYSYYGRMVMETVSIYGLPLTTRFHFHIKNTIDAFIGGGGAYYWFSSKLEDAYYGDLRESRGRHGFGPVFEAGLYTNFFSERWLFMLKGDFAMLETNGKTLSIKETPDPELKYSRTDKYLNITFGVRYLFK